MGAWALRARAQVQGKLSVVPWHQAALLDNSFRCMFVSTLLHCLVDSQAAELSMPPSPRLGARAGHLGEVHMKDFGRALGTQA